MFLPSREIYGLTAFHVSNAIGLGPVFSPVTIDVRVTRMMSGSTSHVPFWFKPVSTFGLLQLTTFSDSSHVLPIPTSLATEPQLCLEFLAPLAGAPSSKQSTLSSRLLGASLLAPRA